MRRIFDIATNPSASTTILLSGGVEDADDPMTWRDEFEEEFPYINFLNPTMLGWSKHAERSIQTTLEHTDEETEELMRRWRMGWDMMMIQTCKRAVMLADALLINMKPTQNTTGTYWEHCLAWHNYQKPIGVLVPADVDPYDYLRTFTFYHADFITASESYAIEELTSMTR